LSKFNKMVSVVLIEKNGNLSETKIKEFLKENLYKKCRFRKPDGFDQRCLWNVKINGERITVVLYGRTHGKAGSENKYDMPPPVDTTLFFGPLLLVRYENDDDNTLSTPIDLTCDVWDKVYEKLFGGFEDLSATALEDEEEVDELAELPSEMKTKNGYLKDGFVVDDEIESSCGDITSATASSVEEFTEDDYESELDYEEYEYMNDSYDENDDDDDDDGNEDDGNEHDGNEHESNHTIQA